MNRRKTTISGISTITATVLVTAILFISTANAAEPMYFSGKYSSFSNTPDFGLWFITFDADGNGSGMVWSNMDQDIYNVVFADISGTDFLFRSEKGYEFSGTVYTGSDAIEGGLWFDSASGANGDMIGFRIDPDMIANNYAGEFAGTYSGATDRGTWEALIFPEGYCTGTLRSDFADISEPTMTLTGYIDASGEIAWKAQGPETELVMRARASSAGYITGSLWRNTVTDEQGTFSGRRSDALPADVIDLRRNAGDDSDFCFIRSLCR